MPIQRSVPVNTFWDIGRNDVTAIWFHQHIGAQQLFVYYFENRLQDLTFYVETLAELKETYKWFYGTHFLPHDVEVTDISSVNNKSRRMILEEAGLRPIKVVPRIRNLNDGIELVRRVFDTCYFDEEGCEVGLRALAGYEWVYDDVHKTTRKTPAHNWASNGADGFRQFAQGYRGPSHGFKEQAARAGAEGSNDRKYAQKRISRQNPVFNPSVEHVR